MRLSIITGRDSWYYPHAEELQEALSKRHEAGLIHSGEEVPTGDCAFFLSYEQIIKKDVLSRNQRNIVVHSSALPKGRGMSPITWQILEGRHEITNTLFEAVEAVDAGPIYLQNVIRLEGHELLDEVHRTQGEAINALILDFVEKLHDLKPRPQVGEATYYRRRSPNDSELDANKTIAAQFDLLRVVDNDKYPAFFTYHGQKYVLKIYKEG